MAFEYGQVRDLYDTLHDAGVVTTSLPDWASEMNRLTQTDLYSAGLHDNLIKRASHSIDKLIEATGLPNYTAQFGREVGAAVGAPDVGERIGRGLPRTTLNFAPLLIPGAQIPTALRLAGTGLLAGAESYTETGSPAAGVVGGASAALLPPAIAPVERAVLGATGSRALSFLAGQGAFAAGSEAGGAASSLLQGQRPVSPFSVENLLGLTLGQAPFAAIHLTGKALGLDKAVDTTNKLIERQQAKEALDQRTPIERIPTVDQPTETPFNVLQETEARLAQVRGQQLEVDKDPTLSPEQKIEKTNLLLNEESELLRTQRQVTGTSILGDSILPTTDRTDVIGKEVAKNRSGTWRAIHVSDDESNPPDLRGKVVGYSTLHEPNPIFGVQTQETGVARYSLPPEQWRTPRNADEWYARGRKVVAEGQPNLPTQDRPASDEELFGHIKDLSDAETEIDAAQTPAELHSALTKVNDVRAQNELPQTTDRTLRQTAATVEKSGLVAPGDEVKVAAKVEVRDAKRRLTRQQQERSAPQLTPDEAAKVSAEFGGEGFSVQTTDKLSHAKSDDVETKPISDVVTDTAFAAVASHEARDAFAKWEGRDETRYDKDAQDFVDLIEHYGTLSKIPTEDAAKFLNERYGTSGWDAGEVAEFLNRPHVKVWQGRLETGLRNIVARTITPTTVRIPAGDNFIWGIRPIETIKGLSKEGVMPTSRFRNVASDRGSMSQGEFDLLKLIVPEAFKGDGVDVRQLYRLLPERGPVLEVRKFGVGPNQDQIAERRAVLIHELDTRWPNWRQVRDQTTEPTEFPRQAPDETTRGFAYELVQNVGDEVIGRNSYSFLAPKPESEMPGYVEGLVKVPGRAAKPTEFDKEGKPLGAGAGELYSGPHFGSEDTNVLAFFRGYEETLPDGTKAFHVIEVQSDWGQTTQRAQERIRVEGRAPTGEAPDHPLLRVYETLALKAAIAHAKEVGATKVILSDAETAMMTEGHDRNGRFILTDNQGKNLLDPQKGPVAFVDEEAAARYKTEHNLTGAEVRPEQLTQEGGMRLHYDQTLPSAMEKLTGERGEGVELGVHKGAQPLTGDTLRQHALTHDATQGPFLDVGSPVFRDASGNPKTQITGRLYDLSKVPDKFTLTDPSRTPGQYGKDESPFVPETEQDHATLERLGVARGGHGLLDYLKGSDIPLIRGLAQDLGKFSDSLTRVSAVVKKMDGVAYARANRNREVTISLSHGLLNADDTHRQLVIAEELVHGLSLSEIDNPAKVGVRNGLEDLRQRIVDALPKDLRRQFDAATESKWFDRYLQDKSVIDELSPNHKDGEILYSLMNTEEFLSRGLSNPIFQNFLRELKAPTKERWFHRFSNYVKELLGIGERVKGTVFEEFLSRTDQLLQSGEYVSGFHNFAEGFYRNLGFSDTLAAGQTQRALGLVIDSAYGLTPRSVFETLDVPGVIRSSEFVRANRGFDQMQRERGEDFVGHAKVMDELGFGVDKRGMDELTHELLVGDVNHDALDVMPQVTTDYLFAKVKDYRDVLASVRAAASEKNKGFVNLADTKALRPVVAESMKAIDRVLKVESEHATATRTIQELQAVAPDGYLDAMVGDIARAPQWMDDADKTRKGFGTWVKNFLQPTGQLARENPEAAEVIARGHQLTANQRKMTSEGLMPFGLDLDAFGQGRHELSKESVKRVENAMKNTRVGKAADSWIHLNQVKGKLTDSVTLLPDNDVDVAKVLTGLTAKERADVSELVQKHQISQQVMQSQTLEKMLQIGATNGAVVAAKSTGLKVSQNITLSDTLLRALTTDRTNPAGAQQADAQIHLVQSKMSPEGFLDLLRYSQGEAEKWKLWQEFFQKNPAWSSGQRYGKFLVEYRRGNRTFLAGVSSRKEAEVVAEGGKITSFERNRQAEEDRPPVLGPDSLGVVTRLRELEQNQLDMLRGSLSPEELQQIRDTSVVEQFATEEAYRGGVPGLRPQARGLTKGAEELPWLSNHFSWVNKTATFWSRQLLRAQARAHLLEPEIAQNPDLQKKLKTHFDSLLHPDPEFAQHVQRFVTTWFMGFNPASAIINATQPFLTHVAELTSLSGRPLDSYRRTLSALDEVKSAVGNRGWKTEEHEWLMKHAAEDGERSYSMFDDDAANQETIATNYKRVLAGNRTQTTGQRLSSLAGSYSTAGMWMFKGVEKINNEAALLSSFDYYREQGLGREEARDKAYEFNHAVNFGGGRAQRSIGAFSGRGTFPRSVAMVATAMQSYVLGTTFQLTRYIQRGFFRPAGITPHEVYAARKAATQMLGTQLIAAGTLGLPFVSGAVALLNAAFPDLELNRHIRELAAGLFSSDSENGSILADAAMTGVPSMFGWDLQSRLSMGNTVPGVSEVNGFQPELLLGAPANLVSTFVKGGQRIAGGDVGGLQSFVPSALKKITDLISTQGTLKDFRERPLFQPTVGETVGVALGFQPKRLSDFNAAARVAKQAEDTSTRRTGQFHQSLAEDVLKGNFGTVRQQLLSRSQTEPNYNPLDGVRAVARAAEELTFPRDLRREGSRTVSTARSQLLSAFRIDPQAPSEVARLQFRSEVERRLGLPTPASAADRQVAFLMDELRRQDPSATRAGLRASAEKLVRRSRLQTLLEPTE